MRYLAMLLMLALLATTTFGQSQGGYTTEASQVPQFVAKQSLGQQLYIKLKTGKFRDGALSRIDADTFEITSKKKVEKIAYMDVASIVASTPAPDPPAQKKSFWKRLGNGFQTGLFIAGFGAIFLASYPTTLLSEGATKSKAKSLRKAIAKSLQPGASKAQVVAFLASRKVNTSEIQTSKVDQPDSLTGQVKKINQIDVGFDGHNWFSFYTNLIRVTFFFDDADHLTDFKVAADSYCDCP